MGLFKKKKKVDYDAKAHEIERNIWELENKQILYLDKLKGVVAKQAEYKEAAKRETDKNMQRHYANLYLNAEKEKEQYAYSINEISKEIVSNAKMAQLVDTQALFVQLENMQSLSLEEIGQMSESITTSRQKREALTQLRNEAIDKAMYHSSAVQPQNLRADELLGSWAQEEENERREREEKEKLEREQAAAEKAVEEQKQAQEQAQAQGEEQAEESKSDDEVEKFLRSLKAGDDV